MRIFRVAGILAWIGLTSGSWASAQTRFRLADPVAIAQSGGGWSVSPAAGTITMSLPVATVQGELPIPLVFGLNASHAVQVNHLWQSVPAWAYTEEGIRYRTTEWVDQGQSFFDRPMYGTIHFGYITGGATYANVPESASYVLEDGRVFRKEDFVPFSTLSSGTFDLAQKFGFSAKAAASVTVDPSGTLGVYTAGLAEFGTWQSALQAHSPVNYGAAPTQYTVMMDKNRARVYAFIATFNAWVPILWVDRFGHSVTFQWTQTTSGLGSGMQAAHCVEAINQRGKGVKVSWATYLSSVTTEMELVRADFVGVAAPSIYVKGYPGLSTVRPNQMAALTASVGIIKPDVPGPILRPTQIQIGSPDAVAMPSWGGATPVKPMAPPPSDPTACPVMTWNFGYDSNHAALTSASDAMGVQATWANTTSMFITPGGVGFGSNPNYIGGIWQATVDSTYLFGATQMDMLDTATNENFRQTWSRTLPDGGAQTQWQVIYRAWFSSKGSSSRYTELIYAPTTSAREYSNGSLMSSRVVANNGTTLSSQTQTWVGGGLNPTVSLSSGSTSSRLGEPNRTVSVSFMDAKNLQIQRRNVFAGSQTTVPAASTTYEWDTQLNLLDLDRPTSVTDTRYNIFTGAALTPVKVLRAEYDLSTNLPTHIYRDGGSTGKDGQAITYDSEGRANFMQVAHDEVGSGLSPYYVSLGFDATSGLPQTKTTRYLDPDSAERGTLVETQDSFDSAGRPLGITDARGLATSLTYDLRGRIQSKATAGTASVDYGYPDEKTTTITQNNRTTTERRDGFGRLVSRTSPDGSKVEFTYDLYGRQNSRKEITWNGVGRTSTLGYDDLDRVTSQTSPNSTGVSTSYSVSSGAYAGANELSVVTKSVMGVNISSMEYRDVFGQLIKQVSPTGEITTAVFDGAGQQTKISITPPAGSSVMTVQERIFSYDGLGRVTSKKEPETGIITFGNFNGLNQPCTIGEDVISNQPTRSRTLIYDGLGRVRRVTNGSDSLSYVYQGADLQSAISSHGSESVVQNYQYWPDASKGKRLKQESTSTVGISPAFSPTIQYDYDGLGRLSTLTYPSQRVVTYGYDQDGRIVEIKNNGQVVVSSVEFDDWGNRSKIGFASGASSVWASKDFGLHLNNWTVKYNATSTLSGPRYYGYDAGERLTTAGEWSISPDASGRVLTANSESLGINTTHSHDAYGNNISHLATGNGVPVPSTLNNFSFSPQPSNGVPGGSTGWTINGMGEATQIGLETGSNQGVALGWDGLGRLAAASATPSGVIQTYRYAPSGMRVNIIDAAQPANNRRFAYTTGGLLLGEYNDSGWKRDVIYLGSEAVAEIDASGVYELHSDHLGTPRVITQGSAIVGTQTYGPYGEYLSNYSSSYQPLTGYTGHVLTDATRLIYMRGRYYSPSWHRFLNSDHGVDQNQLNQRAYVDGEIFDAIDPSGLASATVNCANGTTQHLEQSEGESAEQFQARVRNACGGSGTTMDVTGTSFNIPGVPTTGFGNWGGESGLAGPAYRGAPHVGTVPQSPKPQQKCASKTPYLSLTLGVAPGPAYWTTVTMTSSSLYLSVNHGTGKGLGMLSLAGGLATGNPDSVFTGPGAVATGGFPYFVGGSAQWNPSGHAVDGGFSTPGVAVGMGYGFKIYDANDAQRNPQVFKDNNGNTLERCY